MVEGKRRSTQPLRRGYLEGGCVCVVSRRNAFIASTKQIPTIRQSKKDAFASAIAPVGLSLYSSNCPAMSSVLAIPDNNDGCAKRKLESIPRPLWTHLFLLGTICRPIRQGWSDCPFFARAFAVAFTRTVRTARPSTARFDRHVGALDRALHQRPIILNAVRVNEAVHASRSHPIAGRSATKYVCGRPIV